MQKLDFSVVILLMLPLMPSRGCLQTGRTTYVTFVQQSGAPKKTVRINTTADILFRPELGRMSISINNQTKVYEVSIRQCVQLSQNTISCRSHSSSN